jgi:hypothetical protein
MPKGNPRVLNAVLLRKPLTVGFTLPLTQDCAVSPIEVYQRPHKRNFVSHVSLYLLLEKKMSRQYRAQPQPEP